MKKLTLILLFLPLLSVGQNWQTVPVGQHNIYRVSVPGVDSIWNNYVRNIYVDNVITGFGGDQFNFYRSLRRDENEVLDYSSGATWLGRFFYRDNNGDEIFLNKYLDTIRIKTLAGLNQTWKLGTDTTANKYFNATVINIDTLTIDGLMDSIKTIDIQAYTGSTTTNSVYNNYKIILSKQHGFYKVFDFYGFPNYENAIVTRNTSTINYDSNAGIYPILPYVHTRLDDSVSSMNYAEYDLQWQYQSGNEWIVEGFNNFVNYTYDSIQSVVTISADSLIVTRRRDAMWSNFVGNPPQVIQNFTSTTFTDTVINHHYSGNLKGDSIENNISSISPTAVGYNWQHNFLDNYCSDKFIIRKETGRQSSLSGQGNRITRQYTDLDIDIIYWNQNSPPNSFIHSREFKYYNLNGCSYGNFFIFRPNAVSNYNSTDLFKIYPNPTSGILAVQSDLDWQQIEIVSLQGQVLKQFSFSQRKNMSIQEIPTGLYIVKVATESGNYLQKLLKE